MARSVTLIASFATTLVLLASAPGSARQDEKEDPKDPVAFDKKASEWVNTLIYDKSARQRALAVNALAKLWEDKRYEPALPNIGRALLVDSSVAVRSRAATALGKLRERDVDLDKGAGKDLIDAMAKEKESRVRREIARSIGRYPKVTLAAIKELTAALDDSEAATRVVVAETLSLAGAEAKTAAPGLVPLLEDKDVAVRRSAIVALGRINPEGAPAIAERISKMLSTEKDAEIRQQIIIALRLLNETTPTVLTALEGMLTDPSEDLRQLAARTLGRFGPKAQSTSTALLAMAQKKDEKTELRIDALRAFGLVLGPAELQKRVADLVALLDDSDVEVRATAVEELGALGNALKEDTKTKAALRKKLGDPNVRVRVAADESLKRINAEPKKDPDEKP